MKYESKEADLMNMGRKAKGRKAEEKPIQKEHARRSTDETRNLCVRNMRKKFLMSNEYR